jgi:hypothetical protein
MKMPASPAQMASTRLLKGRAPASNVMPEGTATPLTTLIRRDTAKCALLGKSWTPGKRSKVVLIALIA